MSKKKAKKKAEIPANVERDFGPVALRMRVEDEDEATRLVEAGARCVRQDLDGYHLELDDEARQACGV
jgi:acyl-CoA reductase-like NAD-dependent aldehyde dehydrogenase